MFKQQKMWGFFYHGSIEGVGSLTTSIPYLDNATIFHMLNIAFDVISWKC
jgi:hypothetical protein